MAASQTLALKYTREHEQEADQKGFQTMVKANYDPKGMVTFLNKMYKYSLALSEKVPVHLSTHPATEDRIALLENLIRIEPKSSSPLRATENYKWIQMRAFVNERDPYAAVSHFESLVNANPQEMEALVGLGLAYGKQGRFNKSVEVLQRAASLMPEDLSIRRELGMACFLSGKTDQAIEIFETLLPVSESSTKNAGHLLDLYYLGRGYQEKGDPAKALPLLLKVERAMPEFIDVSLQLGSVYGRIGENGKSHYFFGRYFKLKGDRKSALLHYQKALQWLEARSPEWEEAQRELKELILSKEPLKERKGPS
jgi:predicted Zn-dependent protease